MSSFAADPSATPTYGTPRLVDGTRDPEVDAAYLRLIPTVEVGSSKRQVVARTDDLAGELVVDVDEDGRIIASKCSARQRYWPENDRLTETPRNAISADR